MEIVHPEEKNWEKEQMSIHEDEKRKNKRVEKSLMKKVKIKNEFEKAQEKTKTNHKSPTLSTLWKGWMNEYYDKKAFKIHTKRKKG